MWCCQFREPEIGNMDITELARYSVQMIAGLALESSTEDASRQLWLAACPECGPDAWIVFEEAWLRARWISAHEADLGHFDVEIWSGLSAI